MADVKLERLMNLIAALLHTSVPLSASTIRERVTGYSQEKTAFRRQFSRDKEDLKEMGVVIRVEPVPESDPVVSGYRIHHEDYYLPNLELSQDERSALVLATRLIRADAPTSVTGALWKLGGIDSDPVAVSPFALLPQDPNLGPLHEAIGQKRFVTFSYHGASRSVAPRGLGFKGGNWYVTAWDTNAQELRLFRLDRIEGAAVVGEPHHLPTSETSIGSLQPFQLGDVEQFAAHVRVHPGSLAAATMQINDAQVSHFDDQGWAVLEIQGTNLDGLRTWVLGFGTHMEVLEPPEVRGMIRDWLESIVEAAQ